MPTDPLRALLSSALAWQDAHATFEGAVTDFPVELRGKVAHGLPYSAWQLLEHLRITQHDILDFCVNPSYEEMHWPDDYWPKSKEPPSPNAWDESVASVQRDRAALGRLAEETADLFATIPWGTGQTYARELILVIDHNAYHVGEIIIVRRTLGAWPG
jgi:uncharacterized damage-inducible protein DinB